MNKYPLGLQTFEKIINKNLLYIDKTKDIYNLTELGGYYFYARPRRFGKSLMLSTIKSLYQGKKELFKGLWIENKWDWSKTNPVIHIGFSGIGHKKLGLEKAINQTLNKLAKDFNIQFETDDYITKFKELIEGIAQQKGKVVLLIDEYDKPIIDYLGHKIEIAEENRSLLKSFYSVIKDCDPHIEFMIITGISKFSKVSIFSELNNLTDITFHRGYLGLTGISQQELEENFQEEIKELADENEITTTELKEEIRRWYNGYSWNGKQFLYNPYSLLSYFDFGEFKNFWFETGTPTFLLELMKNQKMVKLENLEVGAVTFSSYSIKHLQLIPLLFQTGYLTIKERKANDLYVLNYPNSEVRNSLLQNIIGFLAHTDYSYSTPTVVHLKEAFEDKKLEHLIRLIKSIFKNIPNQIFKAKGEFYYHSLIYLVFFYLGEYVESEINTNDGRLDAVVKTTNYIYVLEFKLDESGQVALDQIKNKGYAEKYYADSREKILLGINFNTELKTIDEWKSDTLK
ncbi:MAG: AAA family ATPase [Saprospiraceae bacterium]